MKTIFVVLLVVAASLIEARIDRIHIQKFAEFKKNFNRDYSNVNEEATRLKIFADNMKAIDAHNKLFEANLVSYSKAPNKFTDMTNKEFLQAYTGLPSEKPGATRAGTTPVKVPATWKAGFLNLTNNAIPIKNQRGCGSCWAFSATGVFEYYLSKKYATNVDLSEQMCVDCARKNGCVAGWLHECFNYYLANGANYESVYPYTATNKTCAYKTTTNATNGVPKAKAGTWYTIPANETQMAYIISQYGWISASLNANQLQFYKSGIIPATNCSTNVNHGVIFVGYGTDPKLGDYWIARNSWGARWGEFGSFRVQRNKKACGITDYSNYYRIHLM